MFAREINSKLQLTTIGMSLRRVGPKKLVEFVQKRDKERKKVQMCNASCRGVKMKVQILCLLLQLHLFSEVASGEFHWPANTI